MTPRKKKKPESFASRHALPLLIAAITALAALCGAALFALEGFGAPEAVWVRIPAGDGDGAVADSLRTRLGEGFGNKVDLLRRLQGGTAAKAHGAYRIDPGASALRTARRLASGRQSEVAVTFNNIRTAAQLCDRLAANLETTPGAIAAALDSVLASRGFTHAQYPAAFIPDTYRFYWTTTPEALIKRLADRRDAFWSAERRTKARALGLTPVQAATIASIAEEESARADEHAAIGRLYLNRLRRGMKLQADPTVKFAAGDFTIRRIAGPMLANPSPYNTYMHPGLPPGPIRIAEGAAIDALLDSRPHNYIYMCAREDFSGRHNFAADYATHRDNARRYRAELDRRNIR